MSSLRFVVTLLLACCATTHAFAAEGVLEINQTCAFDTGCFPGDTAGLPVTITQPGSYQLTSNLDFRSSSPIAISIRADDVAIDMRGFRIRCLQSGVIVIGGGPPPYCSTYSDNSSGIIVDDLSLRHGAEVKNGSVVGMDNFGVRLGYNSIVRNVRAFRNGIGIQTYFGSLVEGNVLYENETGINLQFSGGYRGNAMQSNSTADVVGGVNLGGNMCGAGLCP